MAGKEYAIVVLSSSPPVPDAFNSPHNAAPTKRVAMPPSSPFALSPPSSPKKQASGALTSGSRAAPIPDKATRGFATVSSLIRSERFAQQIDEEDLPETQQDQRPQGPRDTTGEGTAAAKRPAKRAVKESTPAEGEKPKPKPKPRAQKAKVDKENDNTRTTLDPELRVPRTTTSPFFDNTEAHTATNAPIEPVAPAPKLTKSGKPRKPRAKKEKPEGGNTEPKLKKTRVAKAKPSGAVIKGTREVADGGPARAADHEDQVNTVGEEGHRSANGEQHRDASIWDVPHSPHARQKARKQRHPDDLPEGLDLKEAVSRRRDWTPPRDTAAQCPSTISTGKENRLSAQETLTGNFTHLVSNFTYESPSNKMGGNAIMAPTAVPSVAKRRRVELVELPGIQTTSRATSPEKGKAPKKKPRTITDLVTGQYAPKTLTAEAQAVTSDFSPRATTTKVQLNDVATSYAEAAPKKSQRKRSKSREDSENGASKAKPRARKASAKVAAKPKPVAEKLLSPTSAVSRMNRQDVLFGTSSQLALEESPTTVRQIQRAIKVSEQDGVTNDSYSLRLPRRWPKLERIQGKRCLWRESTRDSDGGLLENTENVYIPVPDRTQDLPLLMDVAREEPDLPAEFVDIDDVVPPAPVAVSSDLPTPPESQSPRQAVDMTPLKLLSDTLFDDIDEFGCGLPPSNQNVESQNSFADIDDFQSAAPIAAQQVLTGVVKPPSSAPTAVVAAGSPQQRRGRPPKAKIAIPLIPASAPLPACRSPPAGQTSYHSPSTPLKGSGRFVDIEEILDSEDDVLEAFSPTPPRARKLQDSPPLPLTFGCNPSISTNGKVHEMPVMPISRIQASHLEWACVKPSICAGITAHIRSIPPTTDPKKPSWHEKILMYDPIILEDFTAYLNSETKLRTYKRATQKQIKAYNSNLKMQGNAILGVERDDQVLAVEKELEVHMVRDWCQELSICCIHAKESRGRGSARKGLY